MNYAIYDEKSGAIKMVGRCPDGHEHLQAADGLAMLPVIADLNTDYIVGDAVVKRPANPAKLSGNKIIDIPTGATVTIGAVDYHVNDGEAELDFTLPGTYTIVVSAFPYQDASFKVTK